MSKPRLILIGAGGHARACIDVIEQCGSYEIVGLIGLPEEMKSEHLGYTVMAIDVDLPRLAKDCQCALIAVGQIQSPSVRINLYKRAIELGLQLPAIVSPTAYVSRHAVIGAGTIVMHGAIINAGTRIGNNCIINTRAIVEHDVTVGDHCHISTGAVLNGDVAIGQGSFVGSGTVIKEGISIGSNCIIGMGLSVRHNQADTIRFTGKPRS
jgi:sugar O-acyltransferase (sialic acid O-acetyltransferase NeuD family)